MPTKKLSHDINGSAGRYSASDQQDVPDYGHTNHMQGRAGEGAPEPACKPWRGRPHDREGQYGYRRDQGADGRMVDGGAPPSLEEKSRSIESPRRVDRWANVRPTWKGLGRQSG